MSPPPAIRITVDGRLALTVQQAADRYGLRPSSITAALSRLGVEPDAHLDDKKKLYLATRLDAIMKGRPGKGANLTAEARAARAQNGSAPIRSTDVPRQEKEKT